MNMIQIITQIMDYWLRKTASDLRIAQQYMAFYNRGTPPTHPLHIGIPSIHTAFNSILITKVIFAINFETLYVCCGIIST